MERAAAVVVAGIGLVLLALAALVFAGPDADARSGGVELAALVTRPPLPTSGPAAAGDARRRAATQTSTSSDR